MIMYVCMYLYTLYVHTTHTIRDLYTLYVHTTHTIRDLYMLYVHTTHTIRDLYTLHTPYVIYTRCTYTPHIPYVIYLLIELQSSSRSRTNLTNGLLTHSLFLLRWVLLYEWVILHMLFAIIVYTLNIRYLHII
jgi:hypothetical protein